MRRSRVNVGSVDSRVGVGVSGSLTYSVKAYSGSPSFYLNLQIGPLSE